MTKHILLLATFAVGLTLAVDASAGTTRREAVKSADTDNNFRLDKKEVKKNFKKEYPVMYEELMTFCEAAVEHPKQNGVDIPADASDDNKQCDTKHVARPFIMAWVAQTEQPEAPADDGRSPSGG